MANNKKKETNEENSTMMIIIINYCDVFLLYFYVRLLRVHFSRFYIDKMYQSITCVNFLGDLSVLSHTHSLSCLLVFFSLTYSSSSFHLIVHPHNFLIRFAGRTREHRAARRLLFFLHANASERLVFCIIVVLLFFLLRLHRRRHHRRRHFILTQLPIHHTNDQQLRVEW
jgi:hypothetical protein